MVGIPPVSESIKDLESAATARALEGDYYGDHEQLTKAWLFLAAKENSATTAIQKAEVLHTGALIAARSALDTTVSAREVASRLDLANRRYKATVGVHTGPYVDGRLPISPPQGVHVSELRNQLLGLYGKGIAGLGLIAIIRAVIDSRSEATLTEGRSRVDAAKVFRPWMNGKQSDFVFGVSGLLLMARDGLKANVSLLPPDRQDPLFGQVADSLRQRIGIDETAE